MASTSRQSKSAPKRRAAAPKEKAAKGQSSSRAKAQARNAAKAPLLDDRSKRDIAGVLCAVLAVALFAIATMPVSGVVTNALSYGLHIGLGLGCYILPFVLLMIAASLFYRKDGQSVSARVALGLMLVFLALLGLLALYTPGLTPANINTVFAAENLTNQGGYVGAGLAWVLMMLFGQLVGTIILVGLLIVAIVVIGFSISALVERLQEKRLEAEQERELALAAAPMQSAYAPTGRLERGFHLHSRVSAKEAEPEPKMVLRNSGAATRGFDPTFGEDDDAQVTRALETHTRKSAPKSAGVTRRLGGSAPRVQSAEFEEINEEPVQKKPESKPLTRKLGKAHKPASSEETKAESTADAAPPKKPAAALSAPRPSEDFVLPSMDLLKKAPKKGGKSADGEETLRETAMLLQDTLADFGVDANVVGWAAGPTVTLFKVSLPSGVRVSKVTNLTDDIALAMASQGVRIFSPIPGTNYVGIEVPNVKRTSVLLSDVLPKAGKGPLEVAIGEDVEGNPIVSDLAKMPHLLIGGTTGSGKSVSINGMIMSILMRATPAEVRFIMIDPKRVEFTPYNGIPHLYVPVVTECKEASSALSWAVAEMERRLKVFSNVGVRNIGQYNAKAQNGMMIGEEPAQELPYIVIIIDELADLMMNVGKEVEFSISRLAQLARAAGIHMIVATQRPSANVVTGLIKANITNRIAFNVASSIDSRVILDSPGAENLIGWGDMLLSKPELPKPQRLQGCLVTEDEIAAVVEHLKSQGEPEYHSEILKVNTMGIGDTMPDGSGGSSSADDPLIWEAADIVVNTGLGSTSNIQRRLKVGYSRAGRIMDMLEEKGIVGPPNGSKPRDVLVDVMELETLKAFEANDE